MDNGWRRKTRVELVNELVAQYGSVDALASRLKQVDGHPAKRFVVIRWRKGGGISVHYANQLARLSRLPAAAYLRPTPEEAAARVAVLVERGRQVMDELGPLLDAVEPLLGEG